MIQYNPIEPAIGSEVWCNGGYELVYHGDTLAQDCYNLSLWVKRIYEGNFTASTASGTIDWFRYICSAELFVPEDLRLTVSRSYTMPDDMYRTRFYEEYSDFDQMRKTPTEQ